MPPPPVVPENELIYKVNKILDSHRQGGKLEYLVDWEGFSMDERSWVAREDVLDTSLLVKFHQTHPVRPTRGRPRRHVLRASGDARGGGGTVTVSSQQLSIGPSSTTHSFTITRVLITCTCTQSSTHL
ncbi:chromo domain-containing cec-1-like protein [Labeo rohita]|nr:chromo domain-containing cec-1-like protein [Labeo rohita]